MSKINFPKKQEQRLIPKYLLEYSEELVKNHPDPSASWGGGGGSPIEAGTGIEITGDEIKTISVDDESVAMVANLAPVAFSGSYNDLSNKPTIPAKTSDLTNDSGFITSASLTNYVPFETVSGMKYVNTGNYYSQGYEPGFVNTNMVTQTKNTFKLPIDKSGTIALTSDIPTVPTNVSAFTNDAGYITSSALSGYATKTWVQNRGYITGITSSDVTTALGYTPGTSNFSGNYNDLTNKPDLSVYELKSEAFSGDYNDLTNKPTLFSGNYNDLTNKPDLSIYETKAEAFSGDYNDLTNKPTIPTVPTNVSAFTNDAGYITGITSSMVTTALGYTPGTSNFSGDYTDLTNKPSIPSTATSTSTVTPSTSAFVTGTTTTTETLTFTYTDNTTANITIVTSVTDSTSNAMTGASVSTTTTLS